MFGMMFQAKVVGVLQTQFNWDIMEPVTAYNHFYKTPLKALCKSIKAKGGNEYDVAIYFILAAARSEFEVNGFINLEDRLSLVPNVAHLAKFGDTLRETALNQRMGL